jgi:hypothetical protein
MIDHATAFHTLRYSRNRRTFVHRYLTHTLPLLFALPAVVLTLGRAMVYMSLEEVYSREMLRKRHVNVV